MPLVHGVGDMRSLSMKKFKFEPQSMLCLIATYLSSLILAYFLDEFVRFSALFELKFFAERINVDNPLVWDITYEICFLFTYIIFHIVFSIAYKSRRKEFIKDTKGLITKKDGLIYHIKHYYVTDIVIIVLQVVAFMVLFLIKSWKLVTHGSDFPWILFYLFFGF